YAKRDLLGNKNGKGKQNMKVVVVVSANAEWEAVKPLFSQAEIQQYLYGESFQAAIRGAGTLFFHTGWGKTASAAALQHILDIHKPDLVINLGTCGGFKGGVERGEVILI